MNARMGLPALILEEAPREVRCGRAARKTCFGGSESLLVLTLVSDILILGTFRYFIRGRR